MSRRSRRAATAIFAAALSLGLLAGCSGDDDKTGPSGATTVPGTDPPRDGSG